MMRLLMNGLDEANHLAIETTLLFFREMMDMKAVQMTIHDYLKKIMKLVRLLLTIDDRWIIPMQQYGCMQDNFVKKP